MKMIYINKVLDAHTAIIFKGSREALERDITLEELHYAIEQLAKDKVLGRDEILAKFYLCVWDEIGPVLLEVLRAGLKAGKVHPHLTHDIIILLAKKGDPLLVSNKRGLILLNYALKKS